MLSWGPAPDSGGSGVPSSAPLIAATAAGSFVAGFGVAELTGVRAVGGVVLLAALQNALRLEDVSGQALNIVTGALLVLSVLLPNIVTSVRGNVQRRKLRASR